MIATDPRLPTRVLSWHGVLTLCTAALVALLAPELLLLRDAQVTAAMGSLFVAVLLGGSVGTLRAWWALRRHRYLLRALALGSGSVEPFELRALSNEVWSMTAWWVIPSVITLALSATVWRPPIIDLPTGVSLTLLGVVILATATLPFYVLVRSSFARALELASHQVMGEVLERAARERLPGRRLQRHLVAAVATPVAFVAIGAALIANAHLRRADERHRDETARALARAACEQGPGVVRGAGLYEALQVAEELGFSVTLLPAAEEYSLKRRADGISELTTPLDEGAAQVRFSGSTVGVLSTESLIITVLAVALAALLGVLLARRLRRDLRRATRLVRRLVAGDIRSGRRYVRDPRFRMVTALAQAIERLTTRFRVFARAQRRAIESREAATRMRGLFFASVSHDLKSPLNAILGFAQVVRQTETLSRGQLESLDLIEQSGQELLALIETILDAARVEAGELDLVRDEVSIEGLFDQAIEKGRHLGGHGSVAVVGEIPEPLPRLSIDQVRITRAIATFVGHAIRTAQQSPVRLRATARRCSTAAAGRGQPSTGDWHWD
jgi:signal transduction histidine kinase